MADTGKHGELTTTNGIHIAYQWAFADSTARAATTNPLTGAAYQADDVGKFSRQLDDNSVWMLTATTPAWVGVSVNSAVSGLTSGRLVIVDTDGTLTDDADLTFSGDTLSATKINSTSITDSGLTSGRVVFVGTSGVLNDDSSLVWDDTNKRLGIGMTSNYSLAVRNSGASQLELYRPTNALNNGSKINFSLNNSLNVDTSYALILGIIEDATASSEKGSITFYVNDSGTISEKMRINSSGQVLIGTTTPTTGSQLDVAGDIVVSDGAGGAIYSEDGSNTLKSSGGVKEYRKTNYTKALGSTICVISITANATISIEMSLLKFTDKFASEEYMYDIVGGVITQRYMNKRISLNIDFNFVINGTDIEIYLQDGAGNNIELTTNNVINLKMMIAPYTSHTSISVTW